jgi:rRNA maturation endonuclease Nob1
MSIDTKVRAAGVVYVVWVCLILYSVVAGADVRKQTAIDTHYLNVLEIMNKKFEWLNEETKCEFCNRQMTEEEHDFCDICGECRDYDYENEED